LDSALPFFDAAAPAHLRFRHESSAHLVVDRLSRKCLVVVGIPYWAMPYSRLSLPDALMGPGLFVVGLTAFLLCACGVTGFLLITLVQAASVPAVAFRRVLTDALKDPTHTTSGRWKLSSHLGTGLLAASAGALTGSLVAYLVRH
jgi:hypothetical protein